MEIQPSCGLFLGTPYRSAWEQLSPLPTHTRTHEIRSLTIFNHYSHNNQSFLPETQVMLSKVFVYVLRKT